MPLGFDRTPQGLAVIRQLSAALGGSDASRARRISEAVLSDLVEGKISDFVRRMKAGGGRDLYGILVREIERPLITLVLKETNGNQIKAAQMLGMNRNTLRKKIRELQITVRRPTAAR
jgi:two-component system nitrogen regulation response regulator GlnG